MSKKSSKKQKSTKSSKEQFMQLLDKLRIVFAAHGVFILFLVASSAIGFALYKSRLYLNPERDEAKYQELIQKNTYSKIDYKIIDKLTDAINDTDIKVTQNISPGRNNPFSE